MKFNQNYQLIIGTHAAEGLGHHLVTVEDVANPGGVLERADLNTKGVATQMKHRWNAYTQTFFDSLDRKSDTTKLFLGGGVM